MARNSSEVVIIHRAWIEMTVNAGYTYLFNGTPRSALNYTNSRIALSEALSFISLARLLLGLSNWNVYLPTYMPLFSRTRKCMHGSVRVGATGASGMRRSFYVGRRLPFFEALCEKGQIFG